MLNWNKSDLSSLDLFSIYKDFHSKRYNKFCHHKHICKVNMNFSSKTTFDEKSHLQNAKECYAIEILI